MATRKSRFDDPHARAQLERVAALVESRGDVSLEDIMRELDLHDYAVRSCLGELRRHGRLHRDRRTKRWHPGRSTAWCDTVRGDGDGPVVWHNERWTAGGARRDPLVAALFGAPGGQARGELD